MDNELRIHLNLIASSRYAAEAFEYLKQHISGWKEMTWVERYEWLKKHFNFSMNRFRTNESDPERIAREDVIMTLNYILSEVREFGLDAVIKNGET